jgi:hypothetical protein
MAGKPAGASPEVIGGSDANPTHATVPRISSSASRLKLTLQVIPDLSMTFEPWLKGWLLEVAGLVLGLELKRQKKAPPERG